MFELDNLWNYRSDLKNYFCNWWSNVWKGFRLYNIILWQLRKEARNRKIRAIFYNWKTAHWIEVRFSLNNRAKRAENRSGWLHARSYHSFRGSTRCETGENEKNSIFGFQCIWKIIMNTRAILYNGKMAGWI